ncbi:sensor domain-containing diguanylate cyclase [Pseudomonas fontis]|uniref:diguanylate cyclase n=1 Tax=Pseudomonas fontis TaxID=2942633 RepID=A0ABT5NSV4_9PSED|nr:sensor domain-containing diguanylate cyclase [Pseudomonas fontis]MDD0975200.1 diguanylate cyclase [Pseudomonas fontis]MDD0991258.1 diguanylate cyclase [Pseudomonas fontis]
MNARFLPPHKNLYRAHPELVLNLCSCVAVMAIVAIVTFLLMRERASVEQSAARSASNIAQLIDTDIERNVELYDLSLQGLIWAVQRPELLSVPVPLRQQVLFNQAFTAPVRGDILWLDKDGNVVADSSSAIPRTANFADTKVFQGHRDNADLGMVISPPFKARLGGLDWCISFSRRIDGPNGEFAGVAAGALRLGYFSELFERLDIGRDSSVNLMNTDGVLLARHPTYKNDPLIGGNFANKPNFQRVLAEGDGSFTSKSSLDGKHRLYTFSRVSDLPLVVVVALSTDDVYSSWRRTALVVSVATSLLCIAILWLTLALGRELRRRHSAEQNLAELAATDSLTGLANRRQLDQVLRREWSRAQRNSRPLAVLMVDVDHFKAFNERHGHAGGDVVLRQVAAAISRSIRRPADLAARYGGEEFLVVLPETELKGAQTLSERIRSSIEALPPFGQDSQPVTVSIGIGLHEPGVHEDLAAVLGDADEALYRAKANGRNRTEV